jgi:thioester reductase-like protein
MKVILTGASGFIGAEVLRQCLRNPSITSLVALSRRELSVAPDPKLKTVLVENWEAYEPSVLRELEGAEACIWYVC